MTGDYMSCVIEFMAFLRYTMLTAILILLINLLVSVEGSAHGLRPKMLPYFDPEYENFNQRINPPRSRTLDSCPNLSVIHVEPLLPHVLTDSDDFAGFALTTPHAATAPW